MLSRVADSLYWMSRYMERSDGIIRMLKVNYASSQEGRKAAQGNSRSALQFVVSNKENQNSLINIVTRARENARSGQDHISKELWQTLNEYYHYIQDKSLDASMLTEDPLTILDNLTRYCVLYYGTADMTMLRGEGYSFINIGKYLERSLQIAEIVALRFADNNLEEEEAEKLIDEVILNGSFPRSVIYSINRLHIYFERLRSEKNISAYNKLNFMIGELHSRVRYSTASSIVHQQGLQPYLGRIKEDLYNIANALNQHYFAYS